MIRNHKGRKALCYVVTESEWVNRLYFNTDFCISDSYGMEYVSKGQQVDYVPSQGIAKGIRLHGYVVHAVDKSGKILIFKDGHGPLDGIPFRVDSIEVYPTIENPWEIAQRACQMARNRAAVKRHARRNGIKIIGPISFDQHGVRFNTEQTVFIPYTEIEQSVS